MFTQNKKLLSIYFTAGFPNLGDTIPVLNSLEKSGVDFVEIGLPFSDPLADGPVIQESSTLALKNGMNTRLLFDHLKEVRKEIQIPLILMGYFNPILQFGIEKFCQKCHEVGIDGLIIPDLPVDIYLEDYRELFQKYNLIPIFLVTPQTSEERIRFIDEISNGFIYLVSSSAVTGAKSSFGAAQSEYFKRIQNMGLKNPTVVGFGISNKATFETATEYANGAIIGSAFIQFIKEHGIERIGEFVDSIR